jgi:hypothetical protein
MRLSLSSFSVSLGFILVSIADFIILDTLGYTLIYLPLALGMIIIGTTIFGTMYLINK